MGVIRYSALLCSVFLASTVALGQCDAVFALGNDTVLCQGSTLSLNAPPGFQTYLWTTGSSAQTITVSAAGTYGCTVSGLNLAGDLVVNGNFNMGAAGFTSDYVPGTGGTYGLLSFAGQYAVATSPHLTHNNFQVFGDHTGGGNMLVVNGAQIAGQNVWCQTITVTPNTNYAFSAWLATAVASDPAELVFTINGVAIGQPLLAPFLAGQWLNFSSTWNSGATTTANICISNQNTSESGNDFALDDISFAPFCTYTDELTVTVQPLPQPDLGDDVSVCAGVTVPLNATTPGADAYLWQDGSTTSSLVATTTGTYWVDVTENGCTARDSVEVLLAPQPSVDLGPDEQLCDGDVLVLNATFPGASYLWQDGSTASTFQVVTTGTVHVTVDLNGCTASDTASFIVLPNPVIDLGADTTICAGNTVPLDATWPGADAYLWQNGTTSATNAAASTGTYWVDVTENGCTTRDSIAVVVAPLPTVDLGPDQQRCAGDVVILDAAFPGATYRWQDGTSASSFAVTGSGSVDVTVDLNGCIAQDTVTFTYFPLPVVDLGPDTTICADTLLTVNVERPGGTYLWQDGSTLAQRTLTVAGPYHVDVTENGCTTRDALLLGVTPLPVVDLGPDQLLCTGLSTRLDALGPGYSYLWNTGDTVPEIAVTDAGTYGVVVTSTCGMVSDSIAITVDLCDCPIFVPNAFTPDGSTINDGFRPVFDCPVEAYRFTVFDRWGQALWQSEDPDKSWDGTSSEPGDTASGIYAWLLEVRPLTVNETTTRRLVGHVVLLR